MNPLRREFILGTASGIGMLAGALPVSSRAAAVSETDPTASALGYKADATKVDQAKFPKYAPPAACGNCSLYQGKAGAPDGPCAIFQGKLVSAAGWCSAYTAKS
jgi:hypothetical protein